MQTIVNHCVCAYVQVSQKWQVSDKSRNTRTIPHASGTRAVPWSVWSEARSKRGASGSEPSRSMAKHGKTCPTLAKHGKLCKNRCVGMCRAPWGPDHPTSELLRTSNKSLLTEAYPNHSTHRMDFQDCNGLVGPPGPATPSCSRLESEANTD